MSDARVGVIEDCLYANRDCYYDADKIAAQQARVNALQLEVIERYIAVGN